MSKLAMYTLVDGICSKASSSALQFHNTINAKPPVGLDNDWFTYEIEANGTTRDAYCLGHNQEDGIVSIWAFGRGGIGVKQLLPKVEALVDNFEFHTTKAGDPISVEFSPANITDIDSSSNGDYIVVATIHYTYWEVRKNPNP